MIRLTAIIALVLFNVSAIDAQRYFTRDGVIHFVSDAPVEKIEAENNKVMAVLDQETGAIEVAALIKSFQFEKALMQEHFNENYMESEQFPKATFKGTADDKNKLSFDSDGTFEVPFTGDLTIHGVTQPVTTTAKFNVKGGQIKATTEFEVTVADYNIEIPKIVRDNIAKVVVIKVNLDLKPME